MYNPKCCSGPWQRPHSARLWLWQVRSSFFMDGKGWPALSGLRATGAACHAQSPVAPAHRLEYRAGQAATVRPWISPPTPLRTRPSGGGSTPWLAGAVGFVRRGDRRAGIAAVPADHHPPVSRCGLAGHDLIPGGRAVQPRRPGPGSGHRGDHPGVECDQPVCPGVVTSHGGHHVRWWWLASTRRPARAGLHQSAGGSPGPPRCRRQSCRPHRWPTSSTISSVVTTRRTRRRRSPRKCGPTTCGWRRSRSSPGSCSACRRCGCCSRTPATWAPRPG